MDQHDSEIEKTENPACKHKPKNEELGYLAWHDWADSMAKKGEKQTQCPVCKKWFFKCETIKENK